MGRVTEAESAHQDRKPLARVQGQGELGQASFGLGVVTAHEEAVVEGHLGDDHARPGEKLAPAQAEFTQRRVLLVEDLKKRAHGILLGGPSIEPGSCFGARDSADTFPMLNSSARPEGAP